MPKKLLSTLLSERTETIEFRAIRKRLMIQAQNNKNTYRILSISEPTKVMLQNEGISVSFIKEDGWDKYILSW